MHRDRISLVLLSLTLAVGAAVSCTTSETVDTQTGRAGTSGSGNAGSGTAGNTSGTAGSGTNSGSSGMSGSGTAGNTTTGTSGTTGTAGSTTGTGGTTGGGGTGGSTSGTAGTNGGTGGVAGSGAGGSAGGAGGAGGSGTGAMVSFANDIYPFITTQCMPCHTKTTNQDGGPLDMHTAMAAYTSLLGTANPATGAPAKTDTSCKLLDAKKLRVEPGDPMHSYIYIKITNSDTTLMGMSCGPAMPETSSHLTLTADQKQKVSDWIMQGAKNN